ncbi:hypothetical protein BDFB_011721 [Asbolus verrucosus]|uniref:Uncharacterized protein n=1 Tax=Asbolus verrucosus TaxID=1661398 RepID=A0A482VG61_ASBVE|nr:hypothetical protein BDFB_011721 [Asbolus verrucosus]
MSVVTVRDPKEESQISSSGCRQGQIHFYKDSECMVRCGRKANFHVYNIDDNGSNGAVTEITEAMNGIQLSSAMNPDFVWGPTMDDKESEDVGVNDVLCSILRNVMWPAL